MNKTLLTIKRHPQDKGFYIVTNVANFQPEDKVLHAEEVLNLSYEDLYLDDKTTRYCWAEVGEKFWGLPVSVYRAADRIDCSLDGVSSKHSDLLLVGSNVPNVFQYSADECVYLVERMIGGREYLHAEPLYKGTFAFGGNYIESSDSRFPNDYPIPVHDRDMSKEK